jgi:hypothetical protein
MVLPMPAGRRSAHAVGACTRTRSALGRSAGSAALHAPRAGLIAGLSAALAAGCASVHFERDTSESGTFSSTAWGFTILSADIPSDPRQTAHGNIADARLPNPIIERELVVPYLGVLDFLLDIISIRYVKISGTWGFEEGGSAATR